MWFTYLENHFPSKRWRKYYKKIIFYALSVNCGLKPSFMWDFGPNPVNVDQLSCFIGDLKNSALISNEIILISVNDHIFISNMPRLLLSLQQNVFVMDVTNNEKEWALYKTNEFVSGITKRIIQSLKEFPPNGKLNLELSCEDCLTTVFGLLLGYPLVYYFKQNYQPVPISLKLYKIKCKFKFSNISEIFVIYSFSIPESFVCPDVEYAVNKFFKNLTNVENTVHEELKLECTLEYVNSLNL